MTTYNKGFDVQLAPRWRKGREFRVRISPEPQTPSEGHSESYVFRRSSIHSDGSSDTSAKERSGNSEVPMVEDGAPNL